MKIEAHIGKSRFKLSDFEKEESKTLYKLSCRQRCQNIMVDCDYFEGKFNPDTGSKDVSFMITIRAFGKNPGETYFYDIYSNPNNPKYNNITRSVKDKDKEVKKGSTEAEKLNKFLNIINQSCDQYIVQFVNFALKNIDNPKKCVSTPAFIKSVISNLKSQSLTPQKNYNTSRNF